MCLNDVAPVDVDHIYVTQIEICRVFETGLGERATFKPLTLCVFTKFMFSASNLIKFKFDMMKRVVRVAHMAKRTRDLTRSRTTDGGGP
jgi:hypothetical protein